MISVRLMTAISGCYTKTLSPIARYVLEEVGFLQFLCHFVALMLQTKLVSTPRSYCSHQSFRPMADALLAFNYLLFFNSFRRSTLVDAFLRNIKA